MQSLKIKGVPSSVSGDAWWLDGSGVGDLNGELGNLFTRSENRISYDDNKPLGSKDD